MISNSLRSIGRFFGIIYNAILSVVQPAIRAIRSAADWLIPRARQPIQAGVVIPGGAGGIDQVAQQVIGPAAPAAPAAAGEARDAQGFRVPEEHNRPNWPWFQYWAHVGCRLEFSFLDIDRYFEQLQGALAEHNLQPYEWAIAMLQSSRSRSVRCLQALINYRIHNPGFREDWGVHDYRQEILDNLLTLGNAEILRGILSIIGPIPIYRRQAIYAQRSPVLQMVIREYARWYIPNDQAELPHLPHQIQIRQEELPHDQPYLFLGFPDIAGEPLAHFRAVTDRDVIPGRFEEIGGAGIDGGGLSRQFFSTLSVAMKPSLGCCFDPVLRIPHLGERASEENRDKLKRLGVLFAFVASSTRSITMTDFCHPDYFHYLKVVLDARADSAHRRLRREAEGLQILGREVDSRADLILDPKNKTIQGRVRALYACSEGQELGLVVEDVLGFRRGAEAICEGMREKQSGRELLHRIQGCRTQQESSSLLSRIQGRGITLGSKEVLAHVVHRSEVRSADIARREEIEALLDLWTGWVKEKILNSQTEEDLLWCQKFYTCLTGNVSLSEAAPHVKISYHHSDVAYVHSCFKSIDMPLRASLRDKETFLQVLTVAIDNTGYQRA